MTPSQKTSAFSSIKYHFHDPSSLQTPGASGLSAQLSGGAPLPQVFTNKPLPKYKFSMEVMPPPPEPPQEEEREEIIRNHPRPPDGNVTGVHTLLGPDLRRHGADVLEYLVNCMAQDFYTFAMDEKVPATDVHKKCIGLIDYALHYLDLPGANLDDCPGILEPKNADALRESIRVRLIESFRSQVPALAHDPVKESLTLDQANVEVQR